MLNEWTVFFGLLFWIGTPIIAHSKNRPWVDWLVGAIFLGPIAFLLVICMPALPREPEARCPWCKGGVRKDAVVCMHCARDMRESPIIETVAPRERLRLAHGLRESPIIETVAASNTVLQNGATVLEVPGGPCRYCGEEGCDVKGLYGKAYHRACHAQALTS